MWPKLLIFVLDNCVDRHAERYPDRVALIWEKDEPGQQEHVTYRYHVPSCYFTSYNII